MGRAMVGAIERGGGRGVLGRYGEAWAYAEPEDGLELQPYVASSPKKGGVHC
jgi:hypothetical protein